jgi:hypothetical protein
MKFNKWLKRRDPKLYNEFAAALGKVAGAAAKNPKVQQVVGGFAKKHGPQAAAALQKHAPGAAKMVKQHGPQAVDMAKKHGPGAMEKMKLLMQQKGGAQAGAVPQAGAQAGAVPQAGAQAGAVPQAGAQAGAVPQAGAQAVKKPGLLGKIGTGIKDFAKGAISAASS